MLFSNHKTHDSLHSIFPNSQHGPTVSVGAITYVRTQILFKSTWYTRGQFWWKQTRAYNASGFTAQIPDAIYQVTRFFFSSHVLQRYNNFMLQHRKFFFVLWHEHIFIAQCSLHQRASKFQRILFLGIQKYLRYSDLNSKKYFWARDIDSSRNIMKMMGGNEYGCSTQRKHHNLNI